MEDARRHLDRRTVVGTLGMTAAVALAGCSAGDDTGDGTGDGAAETGEGSTADLESAVAFPDGEGCAVCNMVAAEHPTWNAQLVHEDGTRSFFCSSGCFAAYYVDPARFDGPASAVANGWVTDYETGELCPAETAYFVRVTETDHVDDIMRMNPTPFADRADAEAFVDSFEAYGDNDIIQLDAFDQNLAVLYRPQFFESA